MREIDEDMTYDERFAHGAISSPADIFGGEFITWPHRAPHRVKNCSFCDSMTIEFTTRESAFVNAGMFTNGILRRRFGRRPEWNSASKRRPSAPGYYTGINFPTCGDEISPPSKYLSDLTSAMNAVSPSGTGRFDNALAWGWRMLLPKWKGEWGPADYPSEYGEKQKIIIMMTDGYSFIYEHEVISAGTDPQPWGWNHGTPEAFGHFENVCDDIKVNEIEIHMVYLQGNENFQPYMERCASSPDHYHEVSNISQLSSVLKDIAVSTGGTRLTR